MIFQPRGNPLAEDRCHDRRRCGDTSDAHQNPKCLAHLDDFEKLVQKDADHSKRGDDDTERTGQGIHDALQEVLNGRLVDRPCLRQFSHSDETVSTVSSSGRGLISFLLSWSSRRTLIFFDFELREIFANPAVLERVVDDRQELSRGRDDGFTCAATRFDALTEGVEVAGILDGNQRTLLKRGTNQLVAALGNHVPIVGLIGLTHPRHSTKISGQLVRARRFLSIPDPSQKDRGGPRQSLSDWRFPHIRLSPRRSFPRPCPDTLTYRSGSELGRATHPTQSAQQG